MRLTIALAGALAISANGLLGAQVMARAGTTRSSLFDEDRPVLGITTGYGGSRDTLGVLVASVTPGSPADKAGIEEGNRLAAINSVNLRLDPADAGEPEMSGVLTRRLTRELGKVKAGQEVDLRVWADGKYRNVKVKPIAAEDLPGNDFVYRNMTSNRAALGLSLSASGSRRDTLGLMVARVTTDGPAEKAGIVEGERLSGIGSVDLRVSSEDAGDNWASNARMNRFRREIAKLKADDEVELKVYGNGRTRTVKVKAIRPADMPRESGAAFYFGEGVGGARMVVPAVPPMPSIAPRTRILRLDDEGEVRVRVDPRIQIEMRERAEEVRARSDEIRARAQVMGREARDRAREMSSEFQRQLRESMSELRWRFEDLDFHDADDEIVRRPLSVQPTPRAPRATPAPARAPARAPRVSTPAPAARAMSVRVKVSM